MADWSALTGGFMQGYGMGNKARQSRQEEKYNALVLKEMGRGSFAKDRGEKKTLDDIERRTGKRPPAYQPDPDFDLPSPYLMRFGDMIKNKFGGKKRKAIDLAGDSIFGTSGLVSEPMGTDSATLPSGGLEQSLGATGASMSAAFPGVDDSDDPQTVVPPPMANGGIPHYADGTPPVSGGDEADLRNPFSQESMDDIEAARRAKRGSNNPFGGPGARTEEQMVEDAIRTRQRAERVARADSILGKATGRPNLDTGKWGRFGRGAARGGAFGVLAGTALDLFPTETDDIRKDFHMELEPGEDPSLAGDIGVRTLGALDRIMLGIPSGLVNAWSGEGKRTSHGASGKWGPPLHRGVDMEEGTPGNPMKLSTTVPDWPRRTALPKKEEHPNVADFDISAEDMPNMTVEDWAKHRMDAMEHAANLGMDPSAAYEYANDQVTRSQIKGFTSFAQQGLMHMEAGNNKAAMAALYAAFQYFPNGQDVKFGIHEGRIYGFALDEKTGKPVKGSLPMAIDPAKVGTLIEQFSNPAALRQFTKDQQEFQQVLRKYAEVDKKKAQSDVDVQSAQIGLLGAEEQYYLGGGPKGAHGGGVLTQADMTRSLNYVKQSAMELGITDPQIISRIASAVLDFRRNYPWTDDETALRTIMEGAKKMMAGGGGQGAAPPAAAPPSGPGAVVPPIDRGANYGQPREQQP